MEKLTIKNCHRADKIQSITNPEWGVFTFNYNGQCLGYQGLNKIFAHTAKGQSGEIVISLQEEWEVLSWKYDFSFEDLYERGVRAFSNTSFSAEERALSSIRRYEAACLEDLQYIAETDRQEEYIDKFKGWVCTMFEKHSRILSVMITGPANFPTKRNEKANASYMKTCDDFERWRNSARRRAKKKADAAMPMEEKFEREWQKAKIELDFSINTISDIDYGRNRYTSRQLMISSLYNTIKSIAKKKPFLLSKTLDYIREVQNSEGLLVKPLFTDKHRVWSLSNEVEEAAEQQTTKEYEYEWGKIVLNYGNNRLQVHHNEKPEKAVIEALKGNGFRWSPANVCWQRILTDNAIRATKLLLKVEL